MRTTNFAIPAKLWLILVFCLAVTGTAHGQILDAIKDALSGKAKQSKSGKSSETPEPNTAHEINPGPKNEFFTSNVSVSSYDFEKQARTESCFSKASLAMRSDWTDPRTDERQTAYTDSEGYFTALNKGEQRWEKTKLLAMEGMDMVGPSTMLSAYKLPVGPYWEAAKKYKEKGLKIGAFLHVGFAFIYKPEHFRTEHYTEKKVNCNGTERCTKFEINEDGYEGSYIMFDYLDKLAEINVVVKDNPQFGSGKGNIEYFYDRGCNFTIPAAVEMKMPGQDLFNMD
ncbi:MAG: hypothetical protein IPM63_13445 [Acidobacteriota bacterium]|nr:MAG: hypothetical protein IPM63_13445 [Acidobacteriota bacterium]